MRQISRHRATTMDAEEFGGCRVLKPSVLLVVPGCVGPMIRAIYRLTEQVFLKNPSFSHQPSILAFVYAAVR
jgi:hypothetical protein